MLAGVGWAAVLLVPGWVTAPHAPEQRSTAAVYRAIASALRAAGTPQFPAAHQAVVTALNEAWDHLSARRARSSGRDPELNRVAALLRQTHPLTEAAVTLVHEGAHAPAGAHRDNRRDRRRYRIRHAGDLSPPARRSDARQPGAGGRRGGSGRPGVGETARRGRGAAPAPAAAGAGPGLRSPGPWAAISPVSSRSG